MIPPPAPYAHDQVLFRARRQRAFIIDGAVNELAFYRRRDYDPSGISVAVSREIAEQNLTKVRDTITIEAGQTRGVVKNDGESLEVEPHPTIAGKGDIKRVPYFDDLDDDLAAEGIRLAKLLARLAVARLDPIV